MNEYEVIYEGRVREIYYVTASSSEEARDLWSDFEPATSETIDGEVTAITKLN